MGLFSKIKGILFEDDEEGEMPVYTKEEPVKKEKVEESVRPKTTPSVEVPSEPSAVRFKAPRAEMEYKDDILDEVVKKEEFEMPKPAKTPEPVVQETPSPFLSFDEEEFERLNSHVVVNDKILSNLLDEETAQFKEYDFNIFETKKTDSSILESIGSSEYEENDDIYDIDLID